MEAPTGGYRFNEKYVLNAGLGPRQSPDRHRALAPVRPQRHIPILVRLGPSQFFFAWGRPRPELDSFDLGPFTYYVNKKWAFWPPPPRQQSSSEPDPPPCWRHQKTGSQRKWKNCMLNKSNKQKRFFIINIQENVIKYKNKCKSYVTI